MKHRVLRDYQFVDVSKKIFVLKANSVIEDYVAEIGSESIDIDRAIIDNNPDFFEPIDWKDELVGFMRKNKFPQPAVLGKKLIPYIEENILVTNNSKFVQKTFEKENLTLLDNIVYEKLLNYARCYYYSGDKNPEIPVIFDKLGYKFNEHGISKL